MRKKQQLTPEQVEERRAHQSRQARLYYASLSEEKKAAMSAKARESRERRQAEFPFLVEANRAAAHAYRSVSAATGDHDAAVLAGKQAYRECLDGGGSVADANRARTRAKSRVLNATGDRAAARHAANEARRQVMRAHGHEPVMRRGWRRFDETEMMET